MRNDPRPVCSFCGSLIGELRDGFILYARYFRVGSANFCDYICATASVNRLDEKVTV